MSALLTTLVDEIRRSGPLTVADFMHRALYDQAHGYYSRAARRSGENGDFYTSVDVGPLFGALLARLTVAVWQTLGRPIRMDVVEVGAGDGRLTRDLLDTLARDHGDCYAAVRPTLVERSAAARDAQSSILGGHLPHLVSCVTVPRQIHGIAFANELLDAFPVHRVRMTSEGLREVVVGEIDGVLVLKEQRPSTPRLAAYFDEIGAALPQGAVADISLAAADWCREMTKSLARGYLLLMDYGQEGQSLYGHASAAGTLRAFSRHMVDPTGHPWSAPAWLHDPGERDLTAHVDFSAMRLALVSGGLEVRALVPQSTLLLSLGLGELLRDAVTSSRTDLRRRLAAKTLVAPEGLGRTHHALLAATRDAPALPLHFEPQATRGMARC